MGIELELLHNKKELNIGRLARGMRCKDETRKREKIYLHIGKDLVKFSAVSQKPSPFTFEKWRKQSAVAPTREAVRLNTSWFSRLQ